MHTDYVHGLDENVPTFLQAQVVPTTGVVHQ